MLSQGLKRWILIQKQSISNHFNSKKPLRIMLEILCYLSFGLAFFSIPTCSFSTSLKILTWIFTIAFIALMVLSMILFYDIKIDFIALSLVLFVISTIIGTALNGFKTFNITPLLLAMATCIIYMYCKSNKKSIHPLFIITYIADILFLFVFYIKYRNELIHFNFSRLGEAFGDENDISIFMALGYVMSFFFLLKIKPIWAKIFFAIFILLFGYGGLSTGSKIFILIALISSIIMIFFFNGRKKLWKSFLIIFALAAIFLIIINLPFLNELKKRLVNFIVTVFTGGNSSSYDYSTAERWEMFKDGISMFLRKPLFGYGIRGFFTSSSFGNCWSHNNFSESLCSFGIVGTFFYHFGLIYAVCCFFKNRKTKMSFFHFMIILTFIICMFSVALNSQKIYSYLIGLSLAYLTDIKDVKSLSSSSYIHRKSKWLSRLIYE